MKQSTKKTIKVCLEIAKYVISALLGYFTASCSVF